MSADRVVYSFVLGWILLIVILIALDWLGNPNRGGFRPKGERPPRNRAQRRADRQRRRLENDASIRATLRDFYGASSLRLGWTRSREDRVRQLDDALIVDDREPRMVDVASHEVIGLDHTAVSGDPLPNVSETDPPVVAEPEKPEVGWVAGEDPLRLTSRGAAPSAATVRRRVWKNHALEGSWGEENRSRLRAGRPPTRTNPLTGAVEKATVDVETGQASWGSEPYEPFEEP